MQFILLLILLFIALIGLLFFLAEREKRIENAVSIQSDEADMFYDKKKIMKKRLRDLIFDCTENSKKCKIEISSIISSQKEILEDICSPSYIDIKGKPCFFSLSNPLEENNIYYYNKNLTDPHNETINNKTLELLNKYEKRKGILVQQIKMFEDLIKQHNDNLNRLNNIQKGDSLMLKLKKHEEKLSENNSINNIEKEAIYNKLVLQEIDDELDYQAECLKQYAELNKEIDKIDISQYNSELTKIIEKINLNQ